MALRPADRKVRNGDRLASKRIPLVLEVEESAGRTGKACDRFGGSGVDPQDENWQIRSGEHRGSTGNCSSSVSKYPRPPWPSTWFVGENRLLKTWCTFLNTHAKHLVSTDFFVVPTVTLRVLYVFVVLAHERRRLLPFNVTSHPSPEWAAQRPRSAHGATVCVAKSVRGVPHRLNSTRVPGPRDSG
jgi:hypothetical protein